ncbi:MAG: TIGR02466 family protein [Cyanobium sp.]
MESAAPLLPETMTSEITPKVLFPSPLWLLDHPASHALNPRLRAQVITAMEADAAAGRFLPSRSNRGGWRGTSFDLESDPLWDHLATFVRGVIRSVLSSEHRWLIYSNGPNIHFKGGYNVSHIHSGAVLSGVYYIACPPGSGSLIFEDPRVQAEFADSYQLFCQDLGGPRVELTPHEGLLVLFPSWLPHRVEPSESDEPRISLPLNIVLADGWPSPAAEGGPASPSREPPSRSRSLPGGRGFAGL